MDNWNEFTETSLLNKENVYIALNIKNISNSDKKLCKHVLEYV